MNDLNIIHEIISHLQKTINLSSVKFRLMHLGDAKYQLKRMENV